MPASCDNKWNTVEDCCATEMMRCPNRNRKKVQMLTRKVCVGVLG
jgi:hypothetical protein